MPTEAHTDEVIVRDSLDEHECWRRFWYRIRYGVIESVTVSVPAYAKPPSPTKLNKDDGRSDLNGEEFDLAEKVVQLAPPHHFTPSRPLRPIRHPRAVFDRT